MSASFNKNRFALRSLWFHRRLAVSIALGVATAATVITGALIVGDSMRGSLRSLTIDRLGSIDQIMIPGGFFQTEGMPSQIDTRTIAPAIYFNPGVIETAPSGEAPVRRASSIQIFGVEPSFEKLDPLDVLPSLALQDDEVILNRAAADELQVEPGQLVTVRLPSEQAVPADSPLGRRDSQTEGIPRLKIKAIIENRGLGRFALHPSQIEPMSAFLNRETVASTIDRSGQANALFVSRKTAAEGGDDTGSSSAWTESLPLRLADLGLKLSRVTKTYKPADGDAATIFDYYQLTSDRLLLPDAAVDRLVDSFEANQRPQPVMTYLANAIERLDENGKVTASVPYSIVTAIDSSESIPLDYGDEPVAGDSGDAGDSGASAPVPVILNDWTSKALSAAVGDRIRLSYYEPEVEGGREIERSFDAILTAIVPITEPSKPYRRNRSNEFASPPTVYNDPDLTPTVPGVTDQDSISDWDLPFKLDREISSADDRYWADHRLTPKAFIPLAAGQQRFGSRFGDTTSLRFRADVAPSEDELQQRIRASLLPIRDKLGWAPITIRQTQLAASRGTTPFDALFLSLSLFVILAAVMLISLLYRLGMLQRGQEYGLLLASGWQGRDVSRLAIREGLWSSLPGVVLGMFGGLGYAWLVLVALRSWWVGAVTVPFLEFHATPRSFLVGAVGTLGVSLITIWMTTRRLRNATAQSLLAGRVESDTATGGTPSRRRRAELITAFLILLAAVITLGVGAMGSGMAQAGAFVGAGMLLLCAALLAIHYRLSKPQARSGTADQPYTLFRLSASNLRRNPLRSTLAIGLMAVATFLIVSIGAFQLRPTESGIGGFSLMARTATPLYRDLNLPAVQAELLGQDRDSIKGAEILSLRLKEGQDASCNNLYQAERPQVLSVPKAMADSSSRVPFDWASSLDPVNKQKAESPWRLLDKSAAGTQADPIPMVLDQNTAMWSLKLGLGDVRGFDWTAGDVVYFQVVALLSNSVLQGSLLIGEENFERAFPEVNGYQFLLINTDQPDRVEEVLENRLGDIGMDVTKSSEVLARMMAVQNTYLKTFQSLGALGLLLGTFGLAIAQLRSMLERKAELAVMRAIGFSRSRLAASIFLETGSLLIAGIGSGLLCSAIAIAPQAFVGQVVPPISQPLIAVALIAMVGLVAGLLSVARVARMPLIESLRG